MYPHAGLTTAEILAAFTDEIAAHGGTVTDTFHDGTRLFTRSVLPRLEEVRPRDRLQGGVALKATEGVVCLHPYVFRLVCRNGAIMAQAVQTRRLNDLHRSDPEHAEFLLREAVRACCAEDVFTESARQIRSAAETEVDFVLNLLPMLSRFPAQVAGQLMTEILGRFFGEGDRSRFGLMNAVTSLARDTADPGLRWDLEELGGGVPACARGPRPEVPARAAVRRSQEVVVG